MQMVLSPLLIIKLRILGLFRITQLLSYLATLDELRPSCLTLAGAKLKDWRLKMLHN